MTRIDAILGLIGVVPILPLLMAERRSLPIRIVAVIVAPFWFVPAWLLCLPVLVVCLAVLTVSDLGVDTR